MKYVALLLLLCVPLQAYDGPGTSDFAVMRLACDARALGMGEAFTSMAEGVYGLVWNPAGLSDIGRGELLLGYRALPEGVQCGLPAFAMKYKQKFALGVAAQYVNAGEIPRYDGLGIGYGTVVTPFSFVGIAGAGVKLSKKLSLGATVKGVYEKLDDDIITSKGLGVDVGIRYLPDYKRVGLGATVQNIGVNTTTQEFSLPLTVRAGATNIFARFPNTRFAFDVVKPIDAVFDYRIGMEYRHLKSLFLRGGYSISQPELERLYRRIIYKESSDAAADRVQSWSAGAGYKTPKLTLDYAIQSWERFGLTHALSLLFPL
jgi:hypothetical protein